jgi:hypothetical protein
MNITSLNNTTPYAPYAHKPRSIPCNFLADVPAAVLKKWIESCKLIHPGCKQTDARGSYKENADHELDHTPEIRSYRNIEISNMSSGEERRRRRVTHRARKRRPRHPRLRRADRAAAVDEFAGDAEN